MLVLYVPLTIMLVVRKLYTLIMKQSIASKSILSSLCSVLFYLLQINFGIAAYVVRMLAKKLKNSQSSHMNTIKWVLCHFLLTVKRFAHWLSKIIGFCLGFSKRPARGEPSLVLSLFVCLFVQQLTLNIRFLLDQHSTKTQLSFFTRIWAKHNLSRVYCRLRRSHLFQMTCSLWDLSS